ncbi:MULTISPECIES: 3-oxoacyl-ACP reductase FabG [unclassified Streptomyces]|uniref:3-oxoacyl-ACP reductase FabG n=1 Tax=unclassified Streptomyces TaxID=2593676 RepID=UPI002257A912|nr:MULTISPECIES: 3-oxoacyl-ACP reductase FabG [unclassified Streptomyces]MCX5051668.1 3-oxoacyl-ACP reductase FabG [Streptomyces sp. NBC_00474]MCX5062016.1 3-oxoacyl-ACP reductase FabG [Streptomyces sp. NBC_00452]MCX5249559.1 3-oxoacyl-ACP reductase FabG [Streptomyces sp. NBC_00201]MCX5292375.1 3-oxoacyl-ACP reductase FabG [Streptomyces sp. NBC_00183]
MPRTALVLGGNRGIGLAVARHLAARGDRVAVSHRTGEPPPGLFAVRCDVTDSEAVTEACTRVKAELGPVEVLVHNAGITHDGPLAAMTAEDFEAPLRTNLLGAFHGIRPVLRGMMRARWGRIVLMSSTVALSGAIGQTNYAASKAGLIGLARSLALEVAGHGITVNVVAPGYTDTDMVAAMPAEKRQSLLATVPMRRMATADEVAAAVGYLTDEAAGYVTGTVLPVDGGIGMGH